MSLYFTVAKNTLYQLIARSFTTIANFIIILLIAKSLGSFGLGQYNKVFAFVGVFSLFVDFGINVVYLKTYKPTTRGLFLLIILRLLMALAIFLLIQPIIFFLPYDPVVNSGFSPTEKIFLEITASLLFLYAFIHSFSAIFQKYERFDLTLWPNAGYGVVAFIVAVWAYTSQNLLLFFLATIFGYSVYIIQAAFLVKEILKQDSTGSEQRSLFTTSNIAFIKSLFVKSLPLGATLFLNVLYVRADVLLLSLLRPTSEVGIYSLAYKFFEFPLTISFFMMSALYPIFLKTHEADKKEFSRHIGQLTGLILLFSISIFLIAFIGAPLIGFIKADFIESILPFRILITSYPIFFLSNLFLWVIITKNKEKMLPVVYLSSLVLNVVLNILLIPTFGYLASSAITVLSELYVLIIFVYILYQTDFNVSS